MIYISEMLKRKCHIEFTHSKEEEKSRSEDNNRTIYIPKRSRYTELQDTYTKKPFEANNDTRTEQKGREPLKTIHSEIHSTNMEKSNIKSSNPTPHSKHVNLEDFQHQRRQRISHDFEIPCDTRPQKKTERSSTSHSVRKSNFMQRSLNSKSATRQEKILSHNIKAQLKLPPNIHKMSKSIVRGHPNVKNWKIAYTDPHHLARPFSKTGKMSITDSRTNRTKVKAELKFRNQKKREKLLFKNYPKKY